jgi:hypothetical protein
MLFGATTGIALLGGFVAFLDELHKAADPKERYKDVPDFARVLKIVLLVEVAFAVPIGAISWIFSSDMAIYMSVVGIALVATFLLALPLYWVALYALKFLGRCATGALKGIGWLMDKWDDLVEWWSAFSLLSAKGVEKGCIFITSALPATVADVIFLWYNTGI